MIHETLKGLVCGVVGAGVVVAAVVAYEMRSASVEEKSAPVHRSEKRTFGRRIRATPPSARTSRVEEIRLPETTGNAVSTANALIDELEDGVEREDFRSVIRTVAKIRAIQREKGESAIPLEVREEAVGALGGFLPKSLPELVSFWGDSNPEIVDDAKSEFEFLLDDSELGDRQLSEMLTTVTRAITDDDLLDSVFACIENDMRNSVAVKTYLEILNTGSDAAKARVWESVEDFTCEDGITDAKKLQDWLRENPDDEDDEEFYGPDEDNVA